MSTATINGTTIAYEVTGEGPPLLFIHGIFVSRSSWLPQTTFFSQEYQVITCDLRGHGESGATEDSYSVSLFADDMFALLDALEIERVVCCGHSFGGMVAQEMALRQPGRIEGLILADTVHGAWVFPVEGLWWMMMRHWIPQFLDVRAQIDLFARYFTMFGPSGDQAFTYIQQETGRYIKNEENFHNILEASLDFSSRTRLEQIKCPTVILVGQYFWQTYPHAYEMLWRIPNAEFHIIPNAGHVLNWDNPVAFNWYIRQFLARLTE